MPIHRLSFNAQLLKAGPGSHRNQYGLLLRRADSRQRLGRGIDRWGNSPVLLPQYDGFVLFVFSLES